MTFVELMQLAMLKDGTGFHGGYTLNCVGFQLHCLPIGIVIIDSEIQILILV